MEFGGEGWDLNPRMVVAITDSKLTVALTSGDLSQKTNADDEQFAQS